VVNPSSLAILHGVPGVTLSPANDEVAFDAKDFMAAFDGLYALIGVARLSWPSVQNAVIAEHRDSTLIRRLQRERLMERWLDVESGRWHAPSAPPSTPGRKYYGSQ
jgi:hypothetical protein